MDANTALQYGDSSAALLNGSPQSVIAANRNLQNTLQQEQSAMQPAVDKFQQTAAQPLPQPPEPKKASPAPDAAQFRQDAQGWVTAMAALSALVGARGRMRGTGALKAFAGGVNGLNQGNQQAFDNAYKTWKANTDAVMKENEEELAKYKTVLENRDLSESEALQEMKMIGYQYQNKVMSDTHTADQAFAVYDSIVKARAGAESYIGKIEAKKAALDAQQTEQQKKNDAIISSFESLSPNDVVPGYGITKQAILDKVNGLNSGLSYPQVGLSMRTMNNPLRDLVDNIKSQQYPNSDRASAIVGFGAEQQQARTVAAAAGRIELAANSLDTMIPVAKKYVKEADLSQFPDMNALEAFTAKHSGDPRYTNLNAALQAIISDHAALMVRGGPPTVEARQAARDMANQYMGKNQIEGYFEVVDAEKRAQTAAISQTQKNITGKEPATSPSENNVIHWDDLK